jgi:hypothetical protein
VRPQKRHYSQTIRTTLQDILLVSLSSALLSSALSLVGTSLVGTTRTTTDDFLRGAELRTHKPCRCVTPPSLSQTTWHQLAHPPHVPLSQIVRETPVANHTIWHVQPLHLAKHLLRRGRELLLGHHHCRQTLIERGTVHLLVAPHADVLQVHIPKREERATCVRVRLLILCSESDTGEHAHVFLVAGVARHVHGHSSPRRAAAAAAAEAAKKNWHVAAAAKVRQ